MAAAQPIIPSTPDLGKAEGKCRSGEGGPALLVRVDGLKDHRGNLKLEVYPANDKDFLQDDNILISEGKTFRRVEQPVGAENPVELCVRIPGPGTYAVSILHDRDGNRKFGLSVDGIAFSGNPKLGLSKPKAGHSSVVVTGNGISRIAVVMNYRTGLMSFGPLRKN
ncbi:DUF2141 domain-containing protein [Novosphingobium flavum]|uniref:DUF2141 domain-containing protein n=2 Tax=Novosphingobium flavum TaxID=1778672 RepID=A0A7X1KMA3_9SPHN|nr:DUF2141 domain-containing protein [Novosphingobium flavum]MBC2666419.1 DUF2141 domain-containing protein [Novosphingobium flavum]